MAQGIEPLKFSDGFLIDKNFPKQKSRSEMPNGIYTFKIL